MAHHLDDTALNELAAIMGADFQLLIETFINDSAVRIDAIQQAISNQDPEEIRRAAHSFKGSAGNMAALQLAELCRQLEQAGSVGQTAGSEQLLEAIINEYNTVKGLLESR